MATSERSTTYVKFTPPGGSEQTLTFVTQMSSEGQLVTTFDVPDTTADCTEYNMPFGSVDKAQYIKIRNRTGQELKMYLNGGSEHIRMAAGVSTWTIEAEEGPACQGVTAIMLKTTQQQVGAGYIDFMIFGDPPAP